jgi:hypothetical protein
LQRDLEVWHGLTAELRAALVAVGGDCRADVVASWIMRILATTALAFSLLVTRAGAAEEVDATPVLRLSVGPAVHVAPAADRSTQIAFDATAGYARLFGKGDVGFVVDPELGYSFDGSGLNAFNLTCGVGLGALVAAVTYNPRLVVGKQHDLTAVGMRNSLILHVYLDMVSLEVGHQMMSYSGALHQSVVSMVGVNPAALVFALAHIQKL